MLASAKLASATILQTNPFGMDPIKFALPAIAVVTILYTIIGGSKTLPAIAFISVSLFVPDNKY
jgi:SSS family solute:Na+ symporter